MKTLLFLVNETCPEYEDPAPILVPEIQCVAVDEIKAAEAKPGSRTLLVTPYGGSTGDEGICSGQYGQWQVLTGFGGQINRGLYAGDSFEKQEGYSSPGVSSTVDCEDTVYKGTKCIAMRERGRWFVFCPKGSGGTVRGSSIAVGLVLGGNALPCSVHDEVERVLPTKRATYPSPDTTEDEFGYLDSEYPIYRPFAYTLPDVDPSGTAQSAPIINDWRKYDLPSTFLLGGKLPRLPDGLCYVRVERPYTIGSQRWDANVDSAPPRPASGDQVALKGLIASDALKLWFRHAASEGLTAGGGNWRLSDAVEALNFPADVTKTRDLNALFTFTKNSLPLESGGVPVGIRNLNFDATGYLTADFVKIPPSGSITALSPSEVEELGSFQVTVAAGILGSYLLTEEVAASIASAALGVGPLEDRAVIIICLNDSGRQGFYAGDIVLVNQEAISFPDQYGFAPGNTEIDTQVRTVYRIIGGSGSNVRANLTSI